VRDRDAGERLRLPLGDERVGRARLADASFLIDGDEAFNLPFSALMRPRKSFVSSTLENFLLREPRSELLEGGISIGSCARFPEPGYSITLGTR